MKKLFNLKFYAAILFCLIFAATGIAQETYKTKKEAEKNAGQGVTFKMPDKFMNAPLQGFKGLTMLNPDAPAAIFVAYPNEGESIKDLSRRVVKAIPGLFFGAKEKEFVWTAKSIEPNQGDKAGSLNTAGDSKAFFQVALFEREWNGLTFVYGYFAMKTENSKKGDLDKYWLDENGKGVKPFEKFVKTFPKSSK